MSTGEAIRSRTSTSSIPKLDAVGVLSEFPLYTHALVSGRRPRGRGRCGARAWSILDGLVSARRRPVAVRLASPGQRLEWGAYLCEESAEEQGDEGERRALSCRSVQTAVARLQCPECGAQTAVPRWWCLGCVAQNAVELASAQCMASQRFLRCVPVRGKCRRTR